MELKDFISNTLEQISLGIKDASEKCIKNDLIVNPKITVGSNGDYYIPSNPEHVKMQRRIQLIEMDIVLTVTESEECTIDGKIGILSIGVGGNSQESKSTLNENRVKFSIPVCLPVSEVIKK